MTTQTVILHCLQASIFGTVFGFGLAATVTDALYVVRRPGLLLRCLLAMFVAMPLVAILIVRIFEVPQATEIALVALAIAPIPPLLPKKESKAGGEGAFALGLMALMGLLAIVVVPLQVTLIGTYFDRDFQMSALAIAKVVLIMIVAPLLLGMLVRAYRPHLADRLSRPVSLLSFVLLLAMAVLVLYAMMPAVMTLIGNGTVVAIVAFIVIGLLVGHFLAGRSAERQTVLALSTASRHPAIALAIAKTNFPDVPLLGATIVLYLIVVTVVAIPYVQWRRHRAPRGGAGQK
jgi:BASS family bile acid:Na+ symporter